MSSPRTNIDRLLRLAALLRDLPPKDFNQGQWYGSDRDPDVRKAKCDMVCCLGGWATTIHPDLIFGPDGLYFQNTRAHLAFAVAFGLDEDVARALTDGDAPHQTPKAAARAVENVAADLAAEHDYEIVEVPA